MKSETRLRFEAIDEAIDATVSFVSGKAFSDYLNDPLLRSAVLWQMVRICETVRQVVRDDSEIAWRITDYRDIISFRTLLIHDYARIDHALVWQYVQEDLPRLRGDVEALLGEPDG